MQWSDLLELASSINSLIVKKKKKKKKEKKKRD